MPRFSTLLFLVIFPFVIHSCKKSNDSSSKFIFEATIDGTLWKADSAKAIQGDPDPFSPGIDNFIIVASDKNGRAFFLKKISPVYTSVDFSVTSANLLYFQAYRDFSKGNAVKLNWATGREEETEKFVIERSFDALNFVTAGEVKAAGNSNVTIEYSWIEKPPIDEAFGRLYYRLKIVDKDQLVTYSHVQMLAVGKPALYIYDATYSYGTNGSINITSNNEEKRILKGTFHFDAIDDNTGNIIKIENGRFENVPY